ncbi:hypothetical protein N7490_011448 [Penicillium lividum]|nr:hypothetical protein N7490_011448 [Penicillium lividum]
MQWLESPKRAELRFLISYKMSGFEVVGIVLGALPLVITAIDQYRVSKKLFQAFRHKEPYIDRLLQSLKEQNFFLESDLFVTLKETFGDRYSFQTTSIIFENPEVAKGVKEYLGDGYEHYIGALSRCEQILTEIVGHIKGLSSEKQNLSTLIQTYPRRNGTYELTKKIKFALARDDLEKRIQDLNDATMMLRRIRDCSLSRTGIAIQSRSSTTKRSTSCFDSIRKHASRLYSAISTAYGGSCHPEHGAHLFLQSRADLLGRTSSRNRAMVFTISFGTVDHAIITEVKVVEDLTSPSKGFGSTRTTRVSYAVSDSIQQPTLSVIQDLCLHLSNIMDTNLQLSEDCQLCYRPGPETIIRQPAALSMVYSLDQVLQPTSAMKPPLNSRIALSFNIASSVMQLNFTQWFQCPLTSNMICLLPGSSEGGSGIQPYISHKFYPSPSDVKCACNVRRVMLELGIILLELWHAETFTTYAAGVGKPLDETFGVRYDMACKWLDISRDHILPFYLDVATRCIECTFATSTASLDWNDTVFRESVFDYVVKPLWENCPKPIK